LSDATPTIGVLLEGGPGPKVLGMLARERNARVVARAKAEVVDAPSRGSVLVVPEHTAITVALFKALPVPTALVRVVSPDHADGVLWGPAEAVRAHRDSAAPAVSARVVVPAGTLYDLSTPARVESASRALLRATEKPTDGYISRKFNRPISRFFSNIFARIGLLPIHASAMCLAVGVAAAWSLAQPSWLGLAIGGMLFQFASVFDGVDGEMARVSLRESPAGARIDTTVDNFTYLACLIAFGVGWYRVGITTADLWLLVGTVVAVVATLLQVLAFVRRYAPDASFVFLDTCVKRAAAQTGLLPLRLAAFAFYALRRDVLAFLLMFVSLGGSRPAILWAVVGGILVANYTMLAHRAALIRAAHA
jgi:phosphatidylglycerophosphate synthase